MARFRRSRRRRSRLPRTIRRKLARRRKSQRRFKRKMQGRVGVFMETFGGKVYISRRKYKVMSHYAKMIIRNHIHEHHHHLHHGTFTSEKHVERHKKAHKLMRKKFYSLVRQLIQKMILQGWYAHWQHKKEMAIAKEADSCLEESRHHHHPNLGPIHYSGVKDFVNAAALVAEA